MKVLNVMKWRNALLVVVFFICKESSIEIYMFSQNFILYKSKCPILIGSVFITVTFATIL
jgi:hypothetical protein